MRKRSIKKITINPNKNSPSIPQNRVRGVVRPANSNLPRPEKDPGIEKMTRQRFIENIKATELVEGNILIIGKLPTSIGKIDTKRRVHYYDKPRSFDLKIKISFLYVNIDNPAEFRHLIREIIPMLSWGSIIFIPFYQKEMRPIDKMWDTFIEDNFMITYTSRQKLLNPHNRHSAKEEYLAIKYLKNPPPINKSKKPLKIATVWRSGGTYGEGHVNGIYNACKKFISSDFEFYCFTDYTGDFSINEINKVPLIHNWPGYWSKMELFRPDVFPNDDVFYLDLDTLITNDITEIATFKTEFFGMRDFNMLNELSSGVLKFESKASHYIYQTFLNNPTFWMKCRGGDQEAIRKILKKTPDFMQDIFPRRMAEFKNHCWNPNRRSVSIPSNYWIVCFHSSPKMDDIQNDPVIRKYWLR